MSALPLLLGAGLLLYGSGKPKKGGGAKALPSVNVGPVRRVTSAKHVGPVRRVTSAKHVRVYVPPDTPRETIAIATLAAKQAGHDPLQPNAAAAKAGAQAMADHVRSKGAKYDRARLAAWQVFAGLKPDGLYGPATVKRLRELGARNVMGNMFKGGAR